MDFRFWILDFRFVRSSAVTFGLVGIISFTSGAHAQSEKPKEPPTFELSAGAIGVSDLPPLFRLEEEQQESGKRAQKWVPFEVPNGSRGAAVKIPLKSPVILYTGSPELPEGPQMKPFLQVPVKKAGERLFLLFHLDDKGQPKHIFLEDSGSSHAAGTVRVVNLTGQRMAFSVGGKPVPVLTGGQQIAQPVMRPDGRFEFKHFEERPGGAAYESPLLYLRFPREDMRLTVVFAPMPMEPDTDENGRPRGPVQYVAKAIQLYDRQPGFVAAKFQMPPALPEAPIIAAPTPGGLATPTTRECSIGLLALGNAWDNNEIELAISGQSGFVRGVLRSGAIVPVKVPAAGEAEISVRKGGVALGTNQQLGSAVTQALLALAPPAYENDPPTVRLFESSRQSHPNGKLRLFNLTPYQLAFTLGKEPVYVNPESSAVIENTSPGTEIPLQVALQVDGKWTLIDRTARKAPAPNSRAGIFVYPVGEGRFAVLEKSL